MATREPNSPVMAERRDFLKRALVTCAYVAPIVMSFSSQELVRARSGKKKPKKDHDDDDD